jgi:hypothetical protein
MDCNQLKVAKQIILGNEKFTSIFKQRKNFMMIRQMRMENILYSKKITGIIPVIECIKRLMYTIKTCSEKSQ